MDTIWKKKLFEEVIGELFNFFMKSLERKIKLIEGGRENENTKTKQKMYSQ